MAKNPKNYGAKDIANWTFVDVDLPQEWLEHIGDIAEGSRILVKGDPKNGKTEYMMKFCKVLINAGLKVNYNSTEQGKSKSFKAAYLRNRMQELPAGKFMLCEKSQKNFETWYRRLMQPNSGKVIVLDSMDYMGITVDQVKLLLNRFPNKTIILVCWNINSIRKAVEHMMDTVIHVKDFKAVPISRLGGNKTMTVWNKQPERGQQVMMAI